MDSSNSPLESYPLTTSVRMINVSVRFTHFGEIANAMGMDCNGWLGVNGGPGGIRTHGRWLSAFASMSCGAPQAYAKLSRREVSQRLIRTGLRALENPFTLEPDLSMRLRLRFILKRLLNLNLSIINQDLYEHNRIPSDPPSLLLRQNFMRKQDLSIWMDIMFLSGLTSESFHLYSSRYTGSVWGW